MKTRRSGRAFVTVTLAFAIGAGCSEKAGQNGGGAGAPASGGSPAGATGGGAGQASGQGGTPGPQGGAASGAGGLVAPGGATGAGGSAGAAGQSGGTAGQGTGGALAANTGGGAGASGSGGGGAECCTEKSCQSEAVKTCVCTQWQQADCCSGDWTTFCQTTAEQKCQARHCLPDPPPTTDGGTVEKGACCAVHSGGGCAEADVEKCVCALLPDCCSNTWDSVCVQLVREKHCEDGVRKCVCETWQQASCCDTQWTSVCAVVAEDKCGAKPSCP